MRLNSVGALCKQRAVSFRRRRAHISTGDCIDCGAARMRFRGTGRSLASSILRRLLRQASGAIVAIRCHLGAREKAAVATARVST